MLSDDRRDRPLNSNWLLAAECREGLRLSETKPRHIRAQQLLLGLAVHRGLCCPIEFTSYSRKKAWWARPHAYLDHALGFSTVVPAIDTFAAEGLLTNEKATSSYFERQSRFRATDALLNASPVIHQMLKYQAPDPLQLRDEEGRPMRFEEDDETRRMRRDLVEINGACTQAIITFMPGAPCVMFKLGAYYRVKVEGKREIGTSLSARPLHRVFNADFSQGGRYYGCGYQQLPSAARRYLCIDGEPTAEMDFGQQHPRILAAEFCLDAPPDRDLYDIPGHPRWLVKTAFNAAINARSFRHARGAVEEAILEKDGGRDYRTKDDCARARAVLEAIEATYPRLVDAFYRGAARWLQRRDADIATEIMLRAIGRGIIVLCLHDSFRCQSRHAGSVEEIMRDVWFARFKSDAVVSQK
jgi:hypothetical protein